MRLILLIVALVCLPNRALGMAVSRAEMPSDTVTSYEQRISWFSRDKAYHFGISAIGAAGMYTLGREVGLNRWQSIALSAVVVGTAGVLREIGTTRRDDLFTRQHLSRKDLVWDAAGIAVGISITDLLAARNGRKSASHSRVSSVYRTQH